MSDQRQERERCEPVYGLTPPLLCKLHGEPFDMCNAKLDSVTNNAGSQIIGLQKKIKDQAEELAKLNQKIRGLVSENEKLRAVLKPQKERFTLDAGAGAEEVI